MTPKAVKIDFKTFIRLVRYFLLDEQTEALYGEIRGDLEGKLDSLSKHDLYTQSKTAKTEQEREKARQEYLDRIGMNNSFRW